MLLRELKDRIDNRLKEFPEDGNAVVRVAGHDEPVNGFRVLVLDLPDGEVVADAWLTT